jgi:hypothetical protein
MVASNLGQGFAERYGFGARAGLNAWIGARGGTLPAPSYKKKENDDNGPARSSRRPSFRVPVLKAFGYPNVRPP